MFLTWPVLAWSIFTGQVDDVVGEIKRDSFEREIGVRDFFAKDHVLVAVVTGEAGGLVGPNVESPNLELFGGNALVVGLNQRDLVKKPIGFAVLGDMLRALAVENSSVDGMPVPLFCSRELRQVVGAENLLLWCV
jgi:hypothetical protein